MSKLIRFDWAIKKILRDKSNFVILEGFLSELLNQSIKIVSLLESESNQETKDDKFNRVDLIAKLDNKELVIIEVQNTEELDYLHRILYGTSKTISENLKIGEAYSKIKKVISVSIVYFDLGEGKDYVYHGTTNFKGIHKKDSLKLSKTQKDLFKISNPYEIFPEYYILKVEKFDEVTKDGLDEWIYFLKNEEIKDEFKAKGLKEAKEKLNIIKLSENDKIEYNIYLKSLHINASVAETETFKISKAEKRKAEEIASKMKKKGYPIDVIGDLTGLSKDEIEVL